MFDDFDMNVQCEELMAYSEYFDYMYDLEEERCVFNDPKANKREFPPYKGLDI